MIDASFTWAVFDYEFLETNGNEGKLINLEILKKLVIFLCLDT